MKIYIVSDYFRYEGNFGAQYFISKALAEEELERRISINEENDCEPMLTEVFTEDD
jgi:hypothetical protein